MRSPAFPVGDSFYAGRLERCERRRHSEDRAFIFIPEPRERRPREGLGIKGGSARSYELPHPAVGTSADVTAAMVRGRRVDSQNQAAENSCVVGRARPLPAPSTIARCPTTASWSKDFARGPGRFDPGLYTFRGFDPSAHRFLLGALASGKPAGNTVRALITLDVSIDWVALRCEADGVVGSALARHPPGQDSPPELKRRFKRKCRPIRILLYCSSFYVEQRKGLSRSETTP